MKLYIVTEHDERMSNPGVIMAVCTSKERANDLILLEGRFTVEEREKDRLHYIMEYLWENNQTPLCDFCNYLIREVEADNWEEI